MKDPRIHCCKTDSCRDSHTFNDEDLKVYKEISIPKMKALLARLEDSESRLREREAELKKLMPRLEAAEVAIERAEYEIERANTLVDGTIDNFDPFGVWDLIIAWRRSKGEKV